MRVSGVRRLFASALATLCLVAAPDNARAQDPDSAGCQFFVCHGDAGFLDGKYTAFGKLVAGGDTLDKIAGAAVKSGGGGEKSRPVEPVKISKVSIVREEGGK